MKKRSLSTIALLSIVALSIFCLGSAIALSILISILALLSFFEFCKMFKVFENKNDKPLIYLGFLSAINLLGLTGFLYNPFLAIFISAINLSFFISFLFSKSSHKDSFKTFGLIILGIILIIWPARGMLNFQKFEYDICGIYYVLIIIFASKLTDIFAYLTGSLVGKHKMCPSLSPKKTWEGAIGGVLFSCLIFYILFFNFAPKAPLNGLYFKEGLLATLIIVLPISILSIFSDLLESKLKRIAKVKDSGSTIPGIGGAYDLLDSMLMPSLFFPFLLNIFNLLTQN